MNRIRRAPLDHTSLFKDIVTDEEFEARKATEPPHRAFNLTALALAELGTSENGYRTKTADQLHVAATIADYVRAIDKLATAQTLDEDTEELAYGLTRNERNACVRDTVVFNHALENLIDNDCGANFNEVLDFTYGMYSQLFRRDTPEQRQQVREKIEQTLNGIRGEVIGDQLLGHLGYDTERPTVEDDMRGIDRHVLFANGWEGIDFKMDPKMAEKKRLKNPGSLTLTVPVPDDVIGTKFRLDPADVPKYASYFETELAREWQRYTAYNTRIEAARTDARTMRRDENRAKRSRTRTRR